MKFGLLRFLHHDLFDIGVDLLGQILIALFLEGVSLLLDRFMLSTDVSILLATFLLVLKALHFILFKLLLEV